MKISMTSQPIVGEFGIEQGYRMIRDAGFEAIDWSINALLPGAVLKTATQLKNLTVLERPAADILAALDEELQVIRQNGLTITQAHAPFPPDFPNIPCRDKVVDYLIGIYRNTIELCDLVGCPNLIIHGFSKTVANTQDSFEDIRAMNWHLYESLIETLQRTNVTVCLENLFTKNNTNYYNGCCADPHEAIEYIDRLNEKAGKECFGFCLDTGHLHLLGGRFGVYAPLLGNRIKALHIHDNDASSDKHFAPYSGSIVWQEFIDAMREIGYGHDLSFECDSQVKTAILGAELVPTFLTFIYAIGDYFRRTIAK